MNEGFAHITVEPIERPICRFCLNRKKLATHVVRANHHFSFMGVSAELEACEEHAEEIRKEWERQIGKSTVKNAC